MFKRLLFAVILLFSFVLQSEAAYSLPKQFTKESSDVYFIDVDHEEDDERNNSFKRSRFQYAEESELEHLPLFFRFFPPKKVFPFFLVTRKTKSVFKPPYSPPDLCIN